MTVDESSPCVPPDSQFSVEVTEAVYLFGKGEDAHGLRGVNLRIPRGAIYALLGPSGCGKTTLMRSLVGLQTLQSGQILAFGKAPGAHNSGVPGPWIGYMPQDICLYPDLTAESHLKYFGFLQCLSSTVLQEKIDLLLQLLEIPHNRMTRNMSGGQQRRLSLAVALIHNPPLLVLDEPTVGVDPLLKKSIWDYLKLLNSTNGTTILFSTHHTEEASKEASLVGFMREGRILVEGNPQWLMTKSKSSTMDEVFLKHCIKAVELREADSFDVTQEYLTTNDLQNNGVVSGVCFLPLTDMSGRNGDAIPLKPEVNSVSVPSTSKKEFDPWVLRTAEHENISTEIVENTAQVVNQLPELKQSIRFDTTRILAIFWKNLGLLRRNFGFIILALFVPLLNILCVKIFVSQAPRNLQLAVVNSDEQPLFSAQFIEKIDHETFDATTYEEFEVAFNLVKTGKVHAVIHFGARYSESLLIRANEGLKTTNSTIEDSIIRLYTNNDNLLVLRSIQDSLFKTFKKMTQEAVVWSDAEPGVTESALKFEKPVLGSEEIDYSGVVVNNAMADGIYVISLIVSTLIFAGERFNGLLERSRVSGIKAHQMITSHSLFIALITTGQIILVLFYLLSFGVEVKGSFVLMLFLLFQTSYLGMSIGTCISKFPRNSSSAMLTLVCVCWIGSILVGAMWPVESQPVGMREISQLHPSAWNYEAVNKVISYGTGISDYKIWRSILLSTGWTILLLFLSGFLIRRGL